MKSLIYERNGLLKMLFNLQHILELSTSEESMFGDVYLLSIYYLICQFLLFSLIPFMNDETKEKVSWVKNWVNTSGFNTLRFVTTSHQQKARLRWVDGEYCLFWLSKCASGCRDSGAFSD